MRLRLVPGLGLDSAAWQPTLAALPPSLRGDAAVIELPGYGRRARRADLGPAAVARALLARLPPDARSVLVGHSASCQVVAHAARQRPDLVAGLVLVAPTTDPRARSWPALAARWLATARHERPGQVPTLVRQYARTGPVTMLRAMDAARRDDVRPPLAEAARPVLVVRGPADRICPADWARSVVAASGHPSSRAVTIGAGGHMVPLTEGPLLAPELADFVRLLEG